MRPAGAVAGLLALAPLALGLAAVAAAQGVEPGGSPPLASPEPAPAALAAAAAQPAERWTLASAAERALSRHPAVALAESQRDLARAELAAAEAERRPHLALAGSAFRYQEPMLVTPIHGFTPGSVPEFDTTLLQGALQLRWELWDGGLRAAQVAERRARVAAAEEGLAAEGQQLVARTVALYLRVVGLAETLAAHRERVVALQAERARVAALLAVGRAAEVDARRVEAAEAAAEAERVSVAVALDSAERDLARLLEVAPEAVRAAALSPLGGLPAQAPERAALLAAALAGSPAVARAAEEERAAAAALAAAQAARRPSLRLESGYLGFADDDGTATAEWNAGVRVGLPLLDGRIAAQVARAEAAAAAARERRRLAEQQVAAELDRALALHAEAVARAAALAAAAERWAEVVRVERLRLEVGVGVQRDYLAAAADLLAAQAAGVEARHAAASARAEAARVAGELDPRWLAAVFGSPAAAPGEAEGGGR